MNVIGGIFSTVGAGVGDATIGGGSINSVMKNMGTVGGGRFNVASGTASTVGGGSSNTASGSSATVPGGWSNRAGGDRSFAAGFAAHVRTADEVVADEGGTDTRGDEGTFVWCDFNGNAGDRCSSTGPNQFLILADGGVGIGTNAPAARLHVVDSVANPAPEFFRITNDSDASSSMSFTTGFRTWRVGQNKPPDGAGIFDAFFIHDENVGTTRFLINTSGNVGIGTNGPSSRLHVAESIDAAATLTNHVALIENTSTGTSPDVLALQVHTAAAPNAGNNFITFFHNTTPIGRIEGGGTGIVLLSGGGDYAEWLPKLHPQATFEPGDIVGVVGGKITKHTQGAHHVMVISSHPIVVGNTLLDDRDLMNYEKVAFMGQVPVNVRGPVRLGDLIVPSGDNDGVAVAVSPTEIAPDQVQRAVGQAWEASTVAGVKKVNTLIGVHPSPSTGVGLAAIEELHEMVKDKDAEVSALQARLTALENTVGKISPSTRVSALGVATPALGALCLFGFLVMGRVRKGGAK